MTAVADHWWWVIPLASFLGGGVTAWGLGLFVTYLVRHPVISVCLDNNKGCTGITPLVELQEQTDEEGRRVQVARFLHDVRYFRLRVENPGLASIKDCCGLITGIKKRTAHGRLFHPKRYFISAGHIIRKAGCVTSLAALTSTWILPH